LGDGWNSAQNSEGVECGGAQHDCSVDPADDDLIRRFLQGEAEAIAVIDGWLARAASPYRRRLAFQWDDIRQHVRFETTRLLQQRTFRGESSLKTYVWRIVSHACVDAIRRLQRKPTDPLDLAESREDPRASPFDRVRERETADLLMQVVGDAAPECRALWTMLLDGLSYQEMTAQLGVAEGALRVRVSRCRQRAVEARDRLIAARAVPDAEAAGNVSRVSRQYE
jgi:RNA polymerase sigma-70 factor (ECF subfamily)